MEWYSDKKLRIGIWGTMAKIDDKSAGMGMRMRLGMMEIAAEEKEILEGEN